MRQNWFSWKSWAVGTICGLAVMCMLGAEIRNGLSGPYKLHVWTHLACRERHCADIMAPTVSTRRPVKYCNSRG